jgi:hypothetical protein
LVGSREEIQAFLGFRHVTGIKPWDADEKAFFIAKMIDEQNMSYQEVMRMIGSTTPAVRRHYIAYRVLLQIEDSVEDYDRERAEESFTILYMTLETAGAKKYLKMDVDLDPKENKNPVPQTHVPELTNLALWLYGDSQSAPIITNTGQVPRFGKALESDDAIAYLKETRNPSLEFAFQLAGGEEEEIIRYIRQAANNVEYALSHVHFYRDSPKLQSQVERLGRDVLELVSRFPQIQRLLLEDITEC